MLLCGWSVGSTVLWIAVHGRRDAQYQWCGNSVYVYAIVSYSRIRVKLTKCQLINLYRFRYIKLVSCSYVLFFGHHVELSTPVDWCSVLVVFWRPAVALIYYTGTKYQLLYGSFLFFSFLTYNIKSFIILCQSSYSWNNTLSSLPVITVLFTACVMYRFCQFLIVH